jgi:hypothetical protein
MGAGRLPGAAAVRPGARGSYNGGVTTGGPGDEGEGGRRRPRPQFVTPQVRFVFAVWCGITVFLVIIYALVLGR